ncbi:MAG: carboxypeptidase regulatory-like domain-containing protein [Verrucomicrobia bacterium]|nr:carboxypeptidase regulatory-like domain-containing protein [Verrucomicrobiota bacterium]
MKTKPFHRLLLATLLLGACAFALTARAADTGATISGAVSNSATRNTLEGALVSIPALNKSILTDNSGRFVLDGVPPGAHELVVTYIGLDAARQTVSVTAGGRATRDFELTTGIYKLEAFKVTGEREGNAAQITEKRNADNVKDVIAMDSFGYLPNMSAGEVVMRLPGVAGSPTDEGLNYRFNIRGMDPNLNNVTVDGGSLTTLGTTRAFELQSITGAMFEAMELIKGQTPDKGADSLGGTINFKTRSTFSMKEDHRTTYNFSMRWAPQLFAETPWRSQHRSHPILNLTHQQVFSVFGGDRNLGASLNLFYSENAVGGFETIFDRTNLLNGPAPIWNYQTWDNINNRKQQSIALKTDYKWSNTTKFSLSVTENDNFERHRRRVRVTAQTGGNTTVPNATTTGVVAGAFTDKITVVRANTVAANPVPVTANLIDVQMDGPLNYYVRMGRVDFTGEHTYPRLNIEYTGGLARTTLNTGQGRGGQLNMRLFNPATQVPGRAIAFGGAGWIIDQTQDTLHPKFIQNGGPDFTDPNNYLPRATDGLTQSRNENDQVQKQFRFDTRYQLPFSAPIAFKTGFHWRSLRVDNWGKDRHRWVPKATLAYDPTVHFAPDPTYVSYDRSKTGRAIPVWQAEGTMTTDGRPNRPELWTEDMYYNESQKYVGTNGVTESIGAEYLMLSGRFGRAGWRARTGFLGGIRFEDVHVDSWGWVKARVGAPSTETAITAAPAVAIAAAQRDYNMNTYRKLYGKFSQKFPSLHLWHDVTRDLKARLSYSTSYGRAGLGNFLPGESINETARTLTVNNPGIKPQQAKNWDATLEYYINQPAGSITFSWFHKDIRDFIVTNQFIGVIPGGTDNGYNGEFQDFSAYSSLNGGTVTVQGWEFAYNQQLTFLPGFLKGLSATFNYSWCNQHGLGSAVTAGGAPVLGRPPTATTPSVYFTRRDIAGFIPMAYNAGLRWSYGKYNARALFNLSGENITTYNALNPGLSQFRMTMKTLTLGAGYQYSNSLGFSVDASNVLNEPQNWYIGYKDRLRRSNINFVTLALAMNGRF